MSDLWWFTSDAARHIEQIVRGTLDPLADDYRRQASELGSAPEVRLDRSHHIGRSQGIQDAARALLVAFGIEDPDASPGPDRLQKLPWVGPISPANRVAPNSKAHWKPWGDQWTA